MLEKKIKVACFERFGEPLDVVKVQEWILPALGPTGVLVQVEYAPINPADLNVLEGRYKYLPQLPAIGGSEGVGIVKLVGPKVSHIKVGQPVVAPTRRGTWCEAYIAEADELIPLPQEIDLRQAAMMIVNPPTAWRMLHDFTELKSGDWIIQNAANSGVGRCVISMAKNMGLRTINLVRRAELVTELKDLGADLVLIDDASLKDQLEKIGFRDPIKLALNAVGGESALRIAKSLKEKGTHVTYGAMSKEHLAIDNRLLIFKEITFKGFSIRTWYNSSSKEQIQKMFTRISDLIVQGAIQIPVEKEYPLDSIREALQHAMKDSRGGKVLVSPLSKRVTHS